MRIVRPAAVGSAVRNSQLVDSLGCVVEWVLGLPLGFGFLQRTGLGVLSVTEEHPSSSLIILGMESGGNLGNTKHSQTDP